MKSYWSSSCEVEAKRKRQKEKWDMCDEDWHWFAGSDCHREGSP